MKKFLSLVLALVMTMSLVTISAGAEDFTDADEMNYVEAVEVMSAINVIDGYADDSFKPQNGLTRGAAAKIICNMILGPTTAGALSADTAPYSDVSVNNTFAGYIAYCAKEGIISGYADGTFRPSAPLTGYAFMKMLLGALGYDADVEQYVGANWSINVAKRALNIGLDDGLVDEFVGTKALTREEAALYAFNTLAAAMVEYETSSTIVVGDITIKNNSVAKEVEAGKADKIWPDDVLNFAEKYFPKLEINEDVEEDAFGRPAHGWLYKGDEVGTYADEADLTYTGAEYDGDLVEDLEEDYDFSDAVVWYNGNKTVGASLKSLNRNGYSIELFINDDDEVTDIVVIEAYAAEITEVETDDDDEITSVDVTVYEATQDGGYTLTVDVEEDEDAYAMIADYEEDDVFMVVLTPGWDDKDEDVDDSLLAVDDVETVEGVVTTTKLSDGNDGWIKVDGVKYEMAWEYSQVDVAVDDEGVFYLYNGYVVHANVDGDDDAQYAFVARVGSETDKWENDTYYAEVVYVDGTVETIEIDAASAEKINGTYGNAVTYSYNEDDEVYNLDLVKGAWNAGAEITKGKTAIKVADKTVGTVNGATVFVVIDKDGDAVDEVNVYTGYKSVKSIETVGSYLINDDSDKVIEYVFAINSTETDSSSDDLIYVAGASNNGRIEKDTDLGNYYTYSAVVDGEIVDIMVKSSINGANEMNGLYDYAKVNSDGVYTKLDAATEDTDYVKVAKEDGTVSFKKAADDVVTIDGEAMAYAEDVVVYVIDTDGDITEGSVNKNYSDVSAILYTTNDDGEVDSIYIEK